VTVTLDQVILHAVVHHSSTSTYMPNFIEIEETFWMDGRTLETGFIRSTMSKSRPNNLAIITTILSFDERAYFCVVSFGHPPHTWTVKSHLCIQYCPWLTQWTEQHISIKIQLIRSMQPKQHPSSNWSVNKKKNLLLVSTLFWLPGEVAQLTFISCQVFANTQFWVASGHKIKRATHAT